MRKVKESQRSCPRRVIEIFGWLLRNEINRMEIEGVKAKVFKTLFVQIGKLKKKKKSKAKSYNEKADIAWMSKMWTQKISFPFVSELSCPQVFSEGEIAPHSPTPHCSQGSGTSASVQPNLFYGIFLLFGGTVMAPIFSFTMLGVFHSHPNGHRHMCRMDRKIAAPHSPFPPVWGT